MRKIMILIFCVFAVGLLITDGWSQTLPKDERGLAIIQVVDKKTGQPANEVFEISFGTSLENPYTVQTRTLKIRVKTDNEGYWSNYVDPGEYFLWILPTQQTSKYQMEPFPGNSQGSVYTIRIEKGKITKFIKKMERGCEMRIVLTDPYGNKFIPRQHMNPNVEVDAALISDGVLGFLEDEDISIGQFAISGNLHDGEVLLGKLFPADYILELCFNYGGYGKIRIENIDVTRENIAEVKVVIDLNNRTGIEGYVKDESGNPIPNHIVTLKMGENIIGNSLTGASGYYRIVGLKPGKYDIFVTIYDENPYHTEDVGIVEIVKDVIIYKDIIDENIRNSIGK